MTSKPIASFNVRTSQSKYYFQCKVFETKEDMYRFYLGYCAKRERVGYVPPSGFCKLLIFAAIVMPYEWLWVHADGTETRKKNIGLCLFCKERLGAGLIAHEMLHCAMWHERLVCGNTNATFENDCGEAEERLAYTLTDFVKGFVNTCYKLKMF